MIVPFAERVGELLGGALIGVWFISSNCIPVMTPTHLSNQFNSRFQCVLIQVVYEPFQKASKGIIGVRLTPVYVYIMIYIYICIYNDIYIYIYI